MISRIRKILKSKKGISTVETACIFLVIMMVFSVILEYANMYTIATVAESDAQRVLDSLVVKNATQIFSSIKNGRSSVFDTQEAELEALGLNWDTYIDDLTDEMGLVSQGTKLYRGDSDENVFIMPAGNNEFKVNTMTEDRLEIEADFRVGRTVYIFGSIPFSYSIPFTIASNYTRKNAISTGEELVTEEYTVGDLLDQGGDQVIDQKPPQNPGSPSVSLPSAGEIVQ